MPAPTSVRSLIARARRRATATLALRELAVWLAAGSAVSLGLVLLDRALGLQLTPATIAWLPGGAALVAACACTIWRRPSSLSVAVALDEALGLKSRLSSALMLSERPGERSAFAELALQDADAVASKTRPERAFPWRWPRAARVVPLFAGAAAAAWFFLPAGPWIARHTPRGAGTPASQAQARETMTLQIEQARRAVAEAAADPALSADQTRVLNQLERDLIDGKTDAGAAGSRSSRALDQVALTLERRAQAEQARANALRDQLARLAPASPGESPLSTALRSADPAAGRNAAQELADRLDQLSPAERQRVARELAALAEEMRRNREAAPAAGADGAQGASPTEQSLESQGVSSDALRGLREQTDASAIRQALEAEGLSPEAAERAGEQLAQEARDRQAQREAEAQSRALEDSLRQTAEQLQRSPANPGSPSNTPTPPGSTPPEPRPGSSTPPPPMPLGAPTGPQPYSPAAPRTPDANQPSAPAPPTVPPAPTTPQPANTPPGKTDAPTQEPAPSASSNNNNNNNNNSPSPVPQATNPASPPSATGERPGEPNRPEGAQAAPTPRPSPGPAPANTERPTTPAPKQGDAASKPDRQGDQPSGTRPGAKPEAKPETKPDQPGAPSTAPKGDSKPEPKTNQGSDQKPEQKADQRPEQQSTDPTSAPSTDRTGPIPTDRPVGGQGEAAKPPQDSAGSKGQQQTTPVGTKTDPQQPRAADPANPPARDSAPPSGPEQPGLAPQSQPGAQPSPASEQPGTQGKQGTPRSPQPTTPAPGQSGQRGQPDQLGQPRQPAPANPTGPASPGDHPQTPGQPTPDGSAPVPPNQQPATGPQPSPSGADALKAPNTTPTQPPTNTPGPGQSPAPQPGQTPPGNTPDGPPGQMPPLDSLRERLEQWQKQRDQAGRDQQSAERLRQRAQELWNNATPAQREQAEKLARELAQRSGDRSNPPRVGRPPAGPDGTGDGPLPAAGGSKGQPDMPGTSARGLADRPMPGRPETAPSANSGESRTPRPRDIAPAGPGRDRVVAEWFSGGAPAAPGGEPDAASGVIRQAAESAQRAVEDRTVPQRFDQLIRAYFRRLPQDLGLPRPPGENAAPSSGANPPAPPAQNAPPGKPAQPPPPR
jgi:hypothetical protein